MTFHDRLQEHATFIGFVLTETGLHVGTGQPSATTDSGVVRNFHRHPYIPGSSLKGALRSAVERRAAWLGPEFRSCGLAPGAPCLSTHKESYDAYRRRPLADRLEVLRETEQLCDTCRLFGSRVLAGKIQFDDLPLDPAFEPHGEQLVEFRDGVGINRDSGVAEERIKYDYEVTPSLTRFRFNATAENLTPKDWRLLALGLLSMMNGEAPLGGKSTRGLGRCRLNLQTLRLASFDGVDEGGDPESALDRLLKHLQGSPDLDVGAPREFLLDKLQAAVPEGD